MILKINLVFGSIFGFLAALMAFLITYQEYYKHEFRGKKLFMISFNAAVVAFFFFLISAIILGIFIDYGGLK
jgi:ribose/xylose/arabinose/galactoside ABC-type transport system permease subunit